MTVICELSKLRNISMIDNKHVSSLGLSELKHISDLRNLNVCSCAVNDEGMTAISVLSSLESLSIASNRDITCTECKK